MKNNSFNLNNVNNTMHNMNNTNNMPCTQFVPPCMFMQSQYTMQPMPQAFQDVVEEDFWQWPGYTPNYPIDTMNWTTIPTMPTAPYSLPMPSWDMSIPTPSMGMPDTTMPTISITPANLQIALDLIKDALAGETEDRLFYEYLISSAPAEEDKNIIKGIRDDEIKHFEMFRQLYKDLTGQMPPSITQEEFTKPSSYCEGLKMAIMGEQNAVVKYRKILFVLTDRDQINKMVEIITDELRHGILYNYLYSKNKCTK